MYACSLIGFFLSQPSIINADEGVFINSAEELSHVFFKKYSSHHNALKLEELGFRVALVVYKKLGCRDLQAT